MRWFFGPFEMSVVCKTAMERCCLKHTSRDKQPDVTTGGKEEEDDDRKW